MVADDAAADPGRSGPTAGSATARGTAGPTRSRRRTTCGRPSTRSARTCSSAARCARRCATCCGAGSTAGAASTTCAASISELREQARRRGDLGGTLDQVRAALDQALAAERETLAARTATTPGWPRWTWPRCPTTRRLRSATLADYDWHSDEARATYESIQADAPARGARRPVRRHEAGAESPDPEAMQRVKDMLADLNELLAAHARGEDTTDQFDEFMDKHGEFFPEQPENVDELIDSLARRQAAAERMMRSLAPSNASSWPADAARRWATPTWHPRWPSWRQPARAAARDGPIGAGPACDGRAAGLRRRRRGGRRAGRPRGAGGAAVRRTTRRDLDDVDVDALERQLGPDAAPTCGALRELERELERQGYLTRGDDGLRLTPRAVRRLGETALKRVFAQLDATGRGDHDDQRTGAADEPTGLDRPWVFGDELPIDAVRTVGNAVLRSAASAQPSGTDQPWRDRGRPGGRGLRGRRDRAAHQRRGGALRRPVVLDGPGGPLGADEADRAGAVAPGPDPVPAGRPGDHRLRPLARRLSPVQLAEVEPEWVQGTNLQHALMLAGRHLRRHPDAEPVVLVVTDGEPTAHLCSRRPPVFHWPTTRRRCARRSARSTSSPGYGATLNIFMLGDDPGLARFVDAIARRAGGRVFTPDIGRLGEYVVADYLRARRGRR